METVNGESSPVERRQAGDRSDADALAHKVTAGMVVVGSALFAYAGFLGFGRRRG